MEKIIMSSL